MPRAFTSRFAPVSSSFVLALAAALLLATQPAHAQARALPDGDGAVRVHVADTVRLFAGKTELARGILLGSDSITLMVQKTHDGETWSVPRANVDRAEVKRGERRGGIRAYRAGVFTGAGIGAAALLLAAASQSHGGEDSSMILGMLAFGVSGTIGMATGAIAALTYSDAWYPFDPQSLVMRSADR